MAGFECYGSDMGLRSVELFVKKLGAMVDSRLAFETDSSTPGATNFAG